MIVLYDMDSRLLGVGIPYFAHQALVTNLYSDIVRNLFSPIRTASQVDLLYVTVEEDFHV